jgi:hypothetical protein
MAMTREEIRRRIRDLIDQAKGADREATARVRGALGQAHEELIRQIAGLPDEASSYARYQLQELRRATERAMEEFDRRLASALKAAQADSFVAGRENVDAILREAVGAPASLADLSRTQLLVAQDYSADLVRGLSQAGRDRLNSTLSRAFLGGQSVTDIIKEIGRTIGDGQFGIISRRAETIYRTEVLRIQSIGTQARLEQAVGRGLPAKKMWVHAGVPARVRVYHVLINRQVVPVDETFAGSGPNGEDLMFPRDPTGAAEDTVNCGCQMMPWLDEFAKFGGLTTPQ